MSISSSLFIYFDVVRPQWYSFAQPWLWHICDKKYAEFIINGEHDALGEKFDPKASRLSLAWQLFKHGRKKLIEAYDTDFDVVPLRVRRDKKMKGSWLNRDAGENWRFLDLYVYQWNGDNF